MPPPFFKCYPSDFLNGVAELTPNALAVYTICMMRMYDEDGPIPDDPVKIARRCNMRLSSCEKALDELSLDGKLIRQNGVLCNNRVISVILTRQERSKNQALNASGKKSQGPENTSKNNDGDEPSHSQTKTNDKPTIDYLSLGIDIESKEVSKREDARAKKAMRLPDDWIAPDSWLAEASAAGICDPNDFAEGWRDYWAVERKDRAAKKTDGNWHRTWLNHVKRNKGRDNGQSSNLENFVAGNADLLAGPN